VSGVSKDEVAAEDLVESTTPKIGRRLAVNRLELLIVALHFFPDT
jgi:hypothetical protein